MKQPSFANVSDASVSIIPLDYFFFIIIISITTSVAGKLIKNLLVANECWWIQLHQHQSFATISLDYKMFEKAN